MKGLSYINSVLEKFCLFVSCICLCLMTIIIAWQIFGRFVLNHSPDWSTAISMLLMVYVGLLMIAVGVRQRFHLRLWIGLDFIGKKYQRYLMMFNYVLVMVLGLYMLIYGIKLMILTSHQMLAILLVSRSIDYASLVISGFCVTLFSLEHIIGLLSDKKAMRYFHEDQYEKEVENDLQYEEL